MWHPTCHSSHLTRKQHKYFAYKYLWLSTSGILHYSFNKNNNNLNAGISSRLHARETAREGGREALSLSTVESIVLLTLWFIILSCLGRCSKRPSHNILLNRSIVHAIRMHVSEVPFSSMVSAHTIVCVYVLCTHYVCVPRPSADSAACV